MRKLILCAFILSLGSLVLGQTDTIPASTEEPPRVKFGMGLHLSVDHSLLTHQISEQFLSTVSSNLETTTTNATGFSIGLTVTVNQPQRFAYRLDLGGRVNNAEMTYRFGNPLPETKHILPVVGYAQPMVEYRLKPEATSIILSGGFNYNLALPSVKSGFDGARTSDLQLVIGGGAKIKTRLVRLQFELLYSHSMMNLMEEPTSIYTQSVDLLQKHHVSLVFHGY